MPYWAVQGYYVHKVKNSGLTGNYCCTIVKKTLVLPAKQDTAAFDDGSVVVVAESDLDGYDASFDKGLSAKDMSGERSLAGFTLLVRQLSPDFHAYGFVAMQMRRHPVSVVH